MTLIDLSSITLVLDFIKIKHIPYAQYSFTRHPQLIILDSYLLVRERVSNHSLDPGTSVLDIIQGIS
jgi:hypothetical protein